MNKPRRVQPPSLPKPKVKHIPTPTSNFGQGPHNFRSLGFLKNQVTQIDSARTRGGQNPHQGVGAPAPPSTHQPEPSSKMVNHESSKVSLE